MSNALDKASTMTALKIQRLERSREQMHFAMAPQTRERIDSLGVAVTEPPRNWSEMVRSMPGAAIAVEVLSDWWAQHPLHAAGTVAAEGARTLITPLAQRHPLGVVAVGLVAGGVFGWSKPWRWIGKPLMLAGLAQQLLHKALPKVPIATLLSALATTTTSAPSRQPHAPYPRSTGIERVPLS